MFFFYFFQNWLWWLKRLSKFSVSHGWRTNSLAVEGAKLCSPVGRTSTHPLAFHKPWASFGGCGARILASTKQHSPTWGSSLPSPKGPSKDASVAMGQWERWQKKKKKDALWPPLAASHLKAQVSEGTRAEPPACTPALGSRILQGV